MAHAQVRSGAVSGEGLRKMKILVLNWQDRTHPFAGGAETHLHEIFSRIAARGHSVTLYCSHFPNAPREEMVDGLRVIREGQRNTFNACVPWRYLRRFQHEDYDVVVDDVNKIPFYTPLYVRKPLLVLAHHLFGKSIFVEAGVLAGLYVYASEWLLNHVYKHTPLTVVSESTAHEFVARGFDNSAISIIHNCITQSAFPFALGAKPHRPTIGYLGRLKRYKSVHHLIQAFAKVREHLPDAELRIMGKGDAEKELRQIAHQLGVQDSVKFLGYVAEHEKARYLGQLHCMVNPSMKEGWGIINIEANACGTPVISANSPGLRDSVSHNESGLLYEYGNIEELSATLLEVLENHALRERLSLGAIRFARQFDWDNAAEQMLERLHSVIASARGIV